jgi:3-oxoadipate enol-lactonase
MALDPERVATSYCVAGDGEPLILIHGLGEDRRSWRPQQTALAPTCRTIAYDVRGHGMTPVGAADGTLEQLGRDLLALIDEVADRPCTLVGYSLGGTIAMWAAAEKPDAVSRLVLLATSAVVGRRAAAGYLELVDLVASGDRQALEEEVRRNAREGAHSDADIDRIATLELDAIGTGEGYANAARAMARLHEEPLTPRLGAIRSPTIVASGEFDTYCPGSAQDTIVDRIPNSEYLEIPGAAHLLNADAPVGVTDIILKALHD